MRWRNSLTPVPMRRVALLAPHKSVRDLLVRLAGSGAVQLEGPSSADEVAGDATSVMRRMHTTPARQRLSMTKPDLDWCEQYNRLDLVAGEAELEAELRTGVRHGAVTGFVGWTPADQLTALSDQLSEVGGAIVPLQWPTAVQPPTLLAPESAGHAFASLVQTYATPPYRDIDPSLMVGITYVAMFGMMFADLGHGALLVAAALLVRFGHCRLLARLRSSWLLLAGAGLSSMVFGGLYGEFFGPTHVLPVVWLAPLDEPVPLLLVAVAIGAALLAGAYALGTVNRFREGGWRKAVYASSGLAGAGIFGGIGILSAALYWRLAPLGVVGAVVVGVFVAFVVIGFFTEAGGGAGGAAQAGVELFDVVIRQGSNVVSFVRLAAFGLTHAALGQVVWQATAGAARDGALGISLAIVVFVVGNALTFSLEALIAGIQALRLEYYELFSRIFVREGQPFRPWQLPVEHVDFVQSSVEA